ncbi:MAG: nucleoside deaminase [Rickettsiales bacterium]|jgi:tRNA(adenine34) deaminase|nr:nucleoside deaminase [Rickettsiales bacterium]
MKQVIKQAIRAAAHNDVPVGAVIVQNGRIIARGENQIELRGDPTLHAEIVAIRRACKKIKNKFLTDCDIFVSLEPCQMCRTAISLARIRRVYFAAPDNDRKNPWNAEIIHAPEFSAQSSELLKTFFRNKRS